MTFPILETIDSAPELEEGFAIGSVLNGKFVIDEKLGQGGMGLTYLAHAVDNKKRKVVIKTILRKLSTPEGKSAFLTEGEALGQINHDGVVRLFENGEDARTGLPYLAMEYVDGQPLTAVLAQGPISIPQTVEFTEKIAFALSALHRERILHRDLKPDNIMIIKDDIESEKLKLIDFGVAKVADSVVSGDTTQMGVFKGTLQYASPEQLNGIATVSGETFTLAMIAYEMATGVRPFQLTVKREKNENDLSFFGRRYEQIKDLQAKGAKDPKAHNAAIPGAMSAVLLKGLAFESATRYKTPLEFARKLKESLRGDFSDDSTIIDPPLAPRSNWTRKMLAALGILLLAGSIVLGLLYWNSLTGNARPASNGPGPELLFTYSFEIQKMKNNIIDGKPFPATDRSSISFGDKFDLKIEREKTGQFYIIEQNVEQWPPAAINKEPYMPSGDFELVFPDNNSDSKSIDLWRVSNRNRVFWLVWASGKLEPFEKKPIDQDKVRQFLHDNQNTTEEKKDKDGVSVKGSGQLGIHMLSFSAEPSPNVNTK